MGLRMLIETRTLPSGSGTELANLFLALGSVADRTGQQAGAALLIVQLLARERLIPLSDARKLIRLLAPDSPNAQRFITARCATQRKLRCNGNGRGRP